MQESWSYHRTKTFDQVGGRWHFATKYFAAAKGEDEPREIYFRNDDSTEFGMLRFERQKDNPYRDFHAIVTKIMNNAPFRRSLHDDKTARIWRKNWK